MARLLVHGLAPIRGSRWIFPKLLATALAEFERGGRVRRVRNHDARWYFGRSLVFWIDPAQLELRVPDRVSDGGREIWLSDRFLDAGDWREVAEPLSELGEHQETSELVRFGKRFHEMPAYQALLRRIAAGKPARRYGKVLDTEAKLQGYFEYFLQLADSIREHGFQEQSALAGTEPKGIDIRGKWALRQRNIGVAVNADGSVLRFLGGRHRTAIAQGLNLLAVPVEIRLVHARWLLDESRRSGLPPALALQDWAKRATRSALGPVAEERG